MKAFKVNISNFRVGEVSKYVNKFNVKDFYYSCSLSLKNLMVSPWGGLIRRQGSKFINKQQDAMSSEVRIIAFEHNNNSILMEIYPAVIFFYLNGEPIIRDGKHYFISNFWISEDQVAQINYVYDDKAECYYFFSNGRTPSVLSFTSDYIFSLKNVDYTDGPYLDINKTGITLTLSAKSGLIEINSSEDLFKSSDALMNQGRFIRVAHKGVWGVARINEFINTKKVKATVSVPFNGTEATKDFKLGAWTQDLGFPSVATIFNGRMYYGVTNKDKKTIWISKVGDYTNMSPTTRITQENVVSDIVAADNSITLSVPNGKNILWLGSNKDNVLVGSQEGTFTLLAFNNDEPISPFNYTVAQLNSQKNSRHSLSTDFLTFYADWNRENIYAIEVSADKMLSLSQINSWSLHLFSSKIKDMIYLDYPSKVLCVLMEDGSLAFAHITPEDGYLSYSWSSHKLGGENTRISSISTSYDENQQYLWLATTRKEKLYEVRSIEVIAFNSLKNMYLDNQKQPLYLDSYLNKNMLNNQITGLELFKRDDVAVIAKNNTFLGIFKVGDDGVLNVLGNSYENGQVSVGLCFDSIYESPYLINLDDTLGDSKIDKVFVRFYKSSNVDIFSEVAQNNIQKNILSGSTINKTGYQDIKINLHSTWQQETSISIKQSLPFSMNIMSLDLEVLSK